MFSILNFYYDNGCIILYIILYLYIVFYRTSKLNLIKYNYNFITLPFLPGNIS